VAKIHYEADGEIQADRFIGALTDFGDRRPELWPNLDAKYYRLHERGETWAEVTEGTDLLGGVWAREHYDWSEPGIVRLRLVDAVDFKPGTEIVYRVTSRADGGCHVAVDFQRIPPSAPGGAAPGGAAPRQILEGVESADWAPNGEDLAVVRTVNGEARLEYPVGKTIYETRGWISSPRVSRDGGRIAFIDHPVAGDDGGLVAVVDRAGKKTSLSPPFGSTQGLAWSPDGSEIWFTAAEVGNRSLYAVSLSGKMRLLTRVTGSLTLQDAARDGRVLLIDEARRLGLSALAPGQTKERDLSWLDWSRPISLSRDGKTALFYESGEGGGAGYSVYVRGTDGSPAVRLGEGQSLALSPDGKWAVALLQKLTNPHLVLYPTGAGQPRPLAIPGLRVVGGVRFLPDSRRLLIAAKEEGRGDRIYLADIDGGKPRAISPENFRGPGPISTDGKRFIARTADGKPVAYPIEGGEPTALAGFEAGDVAVGWTADDSGLFVQRSGAPVAKIERVDLATGRAEPWKEILPSDATGVVRVSSVLISPDGTFYAYAYSRVLSNLYLVEGLK